MTDAVDRSRRNARTAWILGGWLLIAAGAIRFLGMSDALLGPIGEIAFDLVWLAATVVFAVGIRGAGSVVPRRSLGVAALLIAGISPLVFSVLWRILPAGALMGSDLGYGLGYLGILLPPVALVVAGVVIVRADAVPRSLRWVPLLAIVGVVAVAVIAQLIGVAAAGSGDQALASLVWATGIAPVVALVLVGVLAVVRAPSAGAAPVQVFPPSV